MMKQIILLAAVASLFAIGCKKDDAAATTDGATASNSSTPAAGGGAAAAGGSKFMTVVKPAFAKHCVGCHTGAGAKGGVDLAKLQTDADATAAKDVLAKAAGEVEGKKMPPPNRPQPTDDERAALVAALKA